MFEDPKLFRQARTLLQASRREVAGVAGVKESSVVDFEAERRKPRPEPTRKLWAALWLIAQGGKLTREQIKQNENLLDMMLCAHNGLALGIPPDKLLAWFKGEGKITHEEEQRYFAHAHAETEKGGPAKPKRLSPSAAERIRKKANAILGDLGSLGESVAIPMAPRLTFEQALQMPLHEVIDAVTNEIESSPLSLLWSMGQSVAMEDRRAAITAQVTADPRVHIAGAKEWIRHVEKERDDLKQELLKANQELLAANEELLETYRRVVALEKELAEARQR